MSCIILTSACGIYNYLERKHLITKAQTLDRDAARLNRSEPFPPLDKIQHPSRSPEAELGHAGLCLLCCRPSPASGLCTCCPPRLHLLSLSTGLRSHISSSLQGVIHSPPNPKSPCRPCDWTGVTQELDRRASALLEFPSPRREDVTLGARAQARAHGGGPGAPRGQWEGGGATPAKPQTTLTVLTNVHFE